MDKKNSSVYEVWPAQVYFDSVIDPLAVLKFFYRHD